LRREVFEVAYFLFSPTLQSQLNVHYLGIFIYLSIYLYVINFMINLCEE